MSYVNNNTSLETFRVVTEVLSNCLHIMFINLCVKVRDNGKQNKLQASTQKKAEKSNTNTSDVKGMQIIEHNTI